MLSILVYDYSLLKIQNYKAKGVHLAIKHHRGILRDAFFGIKKKRSTPHKLLLYGSVWSPTTFYLEAIIAEYDDKVNNIFQNKLVPQAIRPALFLALE